MGRDGSHQEIWLENLADERDAIALYEGLAARDSHAARASVLKGLAATERRHAEAWRRKLESAGAPIPDHAPSSRVRLLLWIARVFGVKAALPWVVMGESADVQKYGRQSGETAARLLVEEQEHLETLRRLEKDGAAGAPAAEPAAADAAGGERGPRSPAPEPWHRVGRAGSIRAAVFGINDGLVSNVALVLGVAAAGADQRTLVITGFAGLLAGAFSMAVGEFVSVASQRDLLKRQVDLEARELAEDPDEEEAELRAIFQGKGLSAAQAADMARTIMKDPRQALDTLVREELGLDPTDLGSPYGAAGASFVMFAIGAAVPLVPFFVAAGRIATTGSAVLSGAVLAAVGGLLGVLSGTGFFRSAFRMIALAAVAAGATIAIGRLIGVSVS
jgi:VIT1/CCC1 family predicted Fe2+/Mn2+ transporter